MLQTAGFTNPAKPAEQAKTLVLPTTPLLFESKI